MNYSSLPTVHFDNKKCCILKILNLPSVANYKQLFQLLFLNMLYLISKYKFSF